MAGLSTLEKLDRGYEYVAQVRRDSMFFYWRNLGESGKRFDNRIFNKVKTESRVRAYNQIDISEGARKRLSRILDTFLLGAPVTWVFNPFTKSKHQFRAAFLTLTIPSGELVPAQWATKNLLDPLLQRMRRRFGNFSYVWKRELQTKSRLQIHYHFLVDVFVPWTWLQQAWNEILIEKGLMSEYWSKYGDGKMANSVDVESVEELDGIQRYLRKYFLKTNEDLKLTEAQKIKLRGRYWDCSKYLKKCKYVELVYRQEFEDKILKLYNENRVKLITDEKNGLWWGCYFKSSKIEDVISKQDIDRVFSFYKKQFLQRVDFDEKGFNILEANFSSS